MNESKATITKRNKLFNEYKYFAPTIQFIPMSVLYENALKRYRNIVQYTYGPLINNIDNPSKQELKILAVDYLLQEGSNLHIAYHQTYRQVGRSILIDHLAIKTLYLIRNNYSYLAKECNKQISEIRDSYKVPNFIAAKAIKNKLLFSDSVLLALEYNSESTNPIFYKNRNRESW